MKRVILLYSLLSSLNAMAQRGEPIVVEPLDLHPFRPGAAYAANISLADLRSDLTCAELSGLWRGSCKIESSKRGEIEESHSLDIALSRCRKIRLNQKMTFQINTEKTTTLSSIEQEGYQSIGPSTETERFSWNADRSVLNVSRSIVRTNPEDASTAVLSSYSGTLRRTQRTLKMDFTFHDEDGSVEKQKCTLRLKE